MPAANRRPSTLPRSPVVSVVPHAPVEKTLRLANWASSGSGREPAHDQRDVLAAEAEAVGEGPLASACTDLVGHVVEVAVGIGVFVVDGRRQKPVADGHQADDQFGGTGGSDQVAHHALRARNWNLVGPFAEDLLDRQRLHLVVDVGARAMGVDVVDRIGTEAGVSEGHADAGGGSAALWVGVGDSVGISRRAVADHLAVDIRPPPPGVLEVFEHDHCRPFAEHEAVPLVVERPAGPLWLVVAGGEGGEQVEAGHAEGVDHAVTAAGEHYVGLASADDLYSLADRLARGSAGREAVEVRPLGVKKRSQMTRWHVGLLLDLRQRMKCFEAKLRKLRHVEPVAFDRSHHHARECIKGLLALTAAEVNSQPGRIGFEALGEPGITHRLERGPGGKPGMAAAILPITGGLTLLGNFPVSDLGGDLGRKSRGIEDRGHSHA